jgi:hypothetical protein
VGAGPPVDEPLLHRELAPGVSPPPPEAGRPMAEARRAVGAGPPVDASLPRDPAMGRPAAADRKPRQGHGPSLVHKPGGRGWQAPLVSGRPAPLSRAVSTANGGTDPPGDAQLPQSSTAASHDSQPEARDPAKRPPPRYEKSNPPPERTGHGEGYR